MFSCLIEHQASSKKKLSFVAETHETGVSLPRKQRDDSGAQPSRVSSRCAPACKFICNSLQLIREAPEEPTRCIRASSTVATQLAKLSVLGLVSYVSCRTTRSHR